MRPRLIPSFEYLKLKYQDTKSLTKTTINMMNDHYCIKDRNLVVWKFCGNAQFLQSYGQNLPETLRKLRVFTKFPYQEISWNYSILCSVCYWHFSQNDWFIKSTTKSLRKIENKVKSKIIKESIKSIPSAEAK